MRTENRTKREAERQKGCKSASWKRHISQPPTQNKGKTLTCCGFQSNQVQPEAPPLPRPTSPGLPAQMPWAQPTRGPATPGREGPLPPPPISARKGPRRPRRAARQPYRRGCGLPPPGDLRSTWAGPGRTGRGGDRAGGEQVAPKGRHARRAGRAGEGASNFRPGAAGAGAAAPGRGGLALRARVGRRPPASLPLLTCAPPRAHESPQQRGWVAGRGRRAETRPAAPAPVLHLPSSRAPGGSDDGTAGLRLST